MAVTIGIEVDRGAIRQVERAVDRLMSRGAMGQYGRAVRRNTRDRMKDERDVFGRPFEPLSESYAAQKQGPGILRETREMFRTLFVETQRGEARVGTSLARGTWHQEGVDETNLPARTWLGVTEKDEKNIGFLAIEIWEGAF